MKISDKQIRRIAKKIKAQEDWSDADWDSVYNTVAEPIFDMVDALFQEFLQKARSQTEPLFDKFDQYPEDLRTSVMLQLKEDLSYNFGDEISSSIMFE